MKRIFGVALLGILTVFYCRAGIYEKSGVGFEYSDDWKIIEENDLEDGFAVVIGTDDKDLIVSILVFFDSLPLATVLSAFIQSDEDKVKHLGTTDTDFNGSKAMNAHYTATILGKRFFGQKRIFHLGDYTVLVNQMYTPEKRDAGREDLELFEKSFELNL